jgi:DNA mismatch endonuclease (patch repair protein)
MTDRISPERRSLNMRRIRNKDTAPEKVVRSLLHRMGYRFRLHGRKLPGTPDLVLSRYRTVVFVHGCFWHRHPGCKRTFVPSTRREFWEQKFRRNVERDQRNLRELREFGWRAIVVWECEIRNLDALAARLDAILQANVVYPTNLPKPALMVAETPGEYRTNTNKQSPPSVKGESR